MKSIGPPHNSISDQPNLPTATGIHWFPTRVVPPGHQKLTFPKRIYGISFKILWGPMTNVISMGIYGGGWDSIRF